MLTISFLFVLLALVCFALSALKVASRVDLQSAGLFCWLVSQIVR